jgi:hypothetical protein
MKISLSGMAASVGCIILCFILLYGNPYSSDRPNTDTVLIIFTMLVLPACLGLPLEPVRRNHNEQDGTTQPLHIGNAV